MKKHIFTYKNNQLHIENLPLAELAEEYDTPLYVYSYATLKENFLAYENALKEHPHLICYAVKANGNLSILNALAKMGAGFDIVSQGELERVIAAGGDPHKVIFSGVGKQKAEIMGFPVFLVGTNKQLEQMILKKCVTLSSLENIKGYGKKKVAAHGQEIIDLIQKFYEHSKK